MANPTKAERRASWKSRTTATASALRAAGATVSHRTGKRSVPISATTVKPGQTESPLVQAHKAAGSPVTMATPTSLTTSSVPISHREVTRQKMLAIHPEPPTHREETRLRMLNREYEQRPDYQQHVSDTYKNDEQKRYIQTMGQAQAMTQHPIEFTPEQTYQERITETGIEGAKPISAFSMGVYERAKNVSETIRRGEPLLSNYLERQAIIQTSIDLYGFSKAIGYPVRSTASFIEMGGMIPGGLETGFKTPSIIPAAFALGAYQSTFGLAKEAKKDPLQVSSDLATGLLLFRAAGKVPSVFAKFPYRVGLGTPKDLMVKASDVYIPKEIKTPLDIPPRTTVRPSTAGRLYDAYGPKIESRTPSIIKTTSPEFIRGGPLDLIKPVDPYHGTWRTPARSPTAGPEYYMSKVKKPTEYGGTADIYIKVQKAQQQALAKSVAKKYEVNIGTERFEGKSQTIIEPIRPRTPDTPLTPLRGMRKISPEAEALRIGEAARYRQIIGGKKLSDYVRIERKLDLQKTDITMQEASPPKKMITDFPESKIIETTLVKDVGPKIKPMGVGLEPRYARSSLSRFILDTGGSAYLGFQHRPIVGSQKRTSVMDYEGMPITERQRMPIVEQVPRTSVMERSDQVRYDLQHLKVKPSETEAYIDQYKQDRPISYAIHPTSRISSGSSRSAAILPISSSETVPIISTKLDDDVYAVSAPIPGTRGVSEPFTQPTLDTYPSPGTKSYSETFIDPTPEPYAESFDIIAVPPVTPPPLVPEFKFTKPEPEEKRRKEFELTPKKKKALHPWFPASLENVNLEEMSTGKRAIHIKPRVKTQKLFKELITTGRSIKTKAQYESKLPTKIM